MNDFDRGQRKKKKKKKFEWKSFAETKRRSRAQSFGLPPLLSRFFNVFYLLFMTQKKGSTEEKICNVCEKSSFARCNVSCRLLCRQPKVLALYSIVGTSEYSS
jgi:hypothetical protein